MTLTPDADTTRDAFLGGRLKLTQPRQGYRAGVDPILLAASVDARPGQSVLELGCGVGAALFALGTRVPSLQMTGVELQPAYADLARANAAANGLAAEIFTTDLTHLPSEVRQRRFDHVIANPPYYSQRTGTVPRAADRALAHRESTSLADWIATGARRLTPRGTFTVIQRADRLADLLTGMSAHLGSITVTALYPRPGRDASLVIVKAIKGGRAPLNLAAPVFMHRGDRHLADGDDYTDAIRAVLRDAATLDVSE